MATNDKIVKGDVPAYMNDTLRLFYAELLKGETDYAGMLSRLAVIIDSQARSDTADHIFAELEAIKDEYCNPLLDTLYGKGRQYAKVKMKYTNKSALCKNCHKPIYYSDGTWYHLSDGNGQCETPITYAEPDEESIKKEVD